MRGKKVVSSAAKTIMDPSTVPSSAKAAEMDSMSLDLTHLGQRAARSWACCSPKLPLISTFPPVMDSLITGAG